MKRSIGVLLAAGSVLPFSSCAMEAQSGPTACEQMGITIDRSLEKAGYVIRFALSKVSDNSVTGQVVELVSARDEDVCERFMDMDGRESLQIHSNYNTENFFGLEDRHQVCYVSDRNKTDKFVDVREHVRDEFESIPGYTVEITGFRRKSFDSMNDENKNRDVCTEIELPLR